MVNNLCNNIIFTSSAAVYGDAIKMPINENDQLKPCNPYGTSKLKGEEIIQSSHLKYFIFRLFNVSGASDSYQHGVNNEKPQSLIAAVNKRIINHQSPIIYGNNYKTSDGTCSRDYIHVEDISSAFQYVTQNMDNLSPGIFNLGSGKGNTVLEIVKLACKINKVPFTYEIQTNRAGDPNSLLADITLVSSKLK
jgi:UDP-glucose 4-epimerase